jgi:hypothetical protein
MSDYDYSHHTGETDNVALVPGMPRFNTVKIMRDKLIHPNVIGDTGLAQRAAQALRNRKSAIDTAIQDAGG